MTIPRPTLDVMAGPTVAGSVHTGTDVLRKALPEGAPAMHHFDELRVDGAVVQRASLPRGTIL